jgi:cytoplasmic iron level regulating protein YaaA (DUF328/UPF0246 family)
MAPPLILLPPSEGKQAGGTGLPWADGDRGFRSLDGARREVIAALRGAMRGNAATYQKLLGVGAAAASRAVCANLLADSAPTLAAIERYDGVLYDALGYPTLPKRLRTRVDRQVVIVSGLWGLVLPRDPIPDYKLKMGATLAPLGRLSSWWRDRLSAPLDDHVAGRTVWDLLPNEHATAWRHDGRSRLRINVRFLDDVERNGTRELVTVNHWNKLLKGALVRHIIAEQLTDPFGLAEFTHPQGYVFRPDLSTRADGRAAVVFVARRGGNARDGGRH